MRHRERKITLKMCWGIARTPCPGPCRWQLSPETQQSKAIFACDGHLADALRFMGLPAVVITAHEDATEE